MPITPSVLLGDGSGLPVLRTQFDTLFSVASYICKRAFHICKTDLKVLPKLQQLKQLQLVQSQDFGKQLYTLQEAAPLGKSPRLQHPICRFTVVISSPLRTKGLHTLSASEYQRGILDSVLSQRLHPSLEWNVEAILYQ
ncbi:hypothetical protein KIL84_018609 [Mauremys mutica]|uniref:Uncharacterized protein n=1 Tax=Mauremys mutica TaxID=74926 RepID=A0A9D3XVB3_9SAUR|nr:hypothetical protein KIL84_018609 [Mauremys mutica]